MAISFFTRHSESSTQLIAVFGGAQLVRLPDGRHELRGGRQADVTAAKEWIALFHHEVILWRWVA